MSTIDLKLLLFSCVLIGFCGLSPVKYGWQNSKLWTSCSKTCGVGIQMNLVSCVKKTMIGTFEKSPSKNCKALRKPNERTIKTCFLGNCPTNESSENIWKISEWSVCSASCGAEGVRTRDVQCILLISTGSYINAKYQDCKDIEEPNKIERCGYYDCPPEFFKTTWKKCTKMKSCQSPGIRRRHFNCLVTLKNGTSRSVPTGNCYRRSKPPISWENCFQDPEYQTKCKFKNKNEKRKPPIISVSNLKVHQMRNIKKLKLSIGQTAYILPNTKLEIKCPVQNFLLENLQWFQNDNVHTYKRELENRIYVSRKGYLIIKKFAIQDQGIWICKAGSVSAEIRLLIKNPSNGFYDWLSRTIYIKQDIVQWKNSSSIKYIKPVFYQWVIGQWGPCTKSCGSGGFQTRYVNCEIIEPQYYVEVDDKNCKKEKRKKPESYKSCVLFAKCPTWTIGTPNTHECTKTCMDIGQSVKDIKVTCTYENKILPPRNCDPINKPFQTCFNPICSVYWKTENWSVCSSSCGSPGLIIRSVSCRWKNNDLKAGNLCHKLNIRLPLLIKNCSPPPCNLGCMDLSKFCGVKKLCSIDHYQHFCCKTCQVN